LELSEDISSGKYTITEYLQGGFRILGKYHQSAIVISSEFLEPISVSVFDSVDELCDMLQLHQSLANSDVLILGTGPKQKFPDNEILRGLSTREGNHKRVIEVMDTGAACRTYNVLVGDERSVCAILLPA
jgi:uncharacterized protein